MSVVVDASVAAKWLVHEPDSDRARALLAAWQRGVLEGVAPSILPVEIAATLWKRGMRGFIPAETAARLFEKFRRLEFPLVPIEESMTTALTLALRYRHPVYDCLYVALAVETRWDLVTADERLHEVFSGSFPRIRLLRDWPV